MKWKYILLWVGLLTTFRLAAQESDLKTIRARWFNPDSREVMVVAHRTDWRNGGENSLAGIESAISKGVDIIEIDLKMTKDGVLVLMHDQTVNRTTDGEGRVADMTLDELRTLHFKGQGNGGCIPTLEEALTVAKGKIMVNLDHAFDYWDDIMPVLEKTGTREQIILKSGAAPETVLKKYGKYLDKVIFMPIVNLDQPDALKRLDDCLRLLKPQAVEFIYAKKDNPLPEKAWAMMKGKAHVWYNTLWSSLAGGNDDAAAAKNPDKVYGHLIRDCGARILQTDNPQFMIDYLTEKGWR